MKRATELVQGDVVIYLGKPRKVASAKHWDDDGLSTVNFEGEKWWFHGAPDTLFRVP